MPGNMVSKPAHFLSKIARGVRPFIYDSQMIWLKCTSHHTSYVNVIDSAKAAGRTLRTRLELT